MRKKLVFNKTYTSEELCDLERDMSEAFDPVFNEKFKDIPVDESGFMPGSFIVNIEWHTEE